MALYELESQLLALTVAEKAQAIQLLLKSISHTWAGIEKTPGICGGDARIANTRIPVWVLVQARNLGSSEAELLANYPSLTAADLTNAWTYAAAYPQEIQQVIQTNNAA
ncbi:MAG: DUF433 domain-containing protein [Leptolyngbya sp. RL_3_1]|nr:DUF433 domain-containing protein [Leptolyngbya sp. RL_3_1]